MPRRQPKATIEEIHCHSGGERVDALDREIRVSKLQEQGDDADLSSTTTPEQRIDMMWRLVVDGCTLRGQHVDESQFQRNVGRIIRGNC